MASLCVVDVTHSNHRHLPLPAANTLGKTRQLHDVQRFAGIATVLLPRQISLSEVLTT